MSLVEHGTGHKPSLVCVTEPRGRPQIGGPIITKPIEPTGKVRIGPDAAVPARFRADVPLIDPPVMVELEVHVPAGGKPAATSMAIHCDRSAPLTTTVLRRIPVDQLLRAALEKATVKAAPVEGSAKHFRTEGDPENVAWGGDALPLEGAGRSTPLELAQRAAQHYSKALGEGSKSPAMAVVHEMNVSRSTAARYIREARKRGLLPPLGE